MLSPVTTTVLKELGKIASETTYHAKQNNACSCLINFTAPERLVSYPVHPAQLFSIFFQLESGLNSCMELAISAVFDPRSFS